MPPPEGDEEKLKEGKRFLTLNKLTLEITQTN